MTPTPRRVSITVGVFALFSGAVCAGACRDWPPGLVFGLATLLAGLAILVSTQGRRLCSLNRHRRVWTPDPVPGLSITGAGLPERAYIVAPEDLDRAGLVDPTDDTVLTLGSSRPMIVRCQRPECGRCGAPLRLAVRHLLGWESYGDG